MHSLLRRWLHKFHRLTDLGIHSSSSINAKERSKPAEVPTQYVCEELASEFAKFWTKIREHDGQGLEEIQLDALTRWHAFPFELGTITKNHPLPLDAIVDVFDDYFFLGSLRPYIKVSFVTDTPANSPWLGLTREHRRSISTPPRILIEIKRPPPAQRLWTRELVQDLLDTLLHEMSHAFLIVYGAPEGFLGRWRSGRVVDTEGLTGHGPCWVEVARAVAAEAERSLGSVWDRWELKIEDSRVLEEEALREPGLW